MIVNFPTEIEGQLQRRAAVAGLDAESFVRHIVTERLAQEEEPSPPRPVSRNDFGAKLRDIIKRHGIRNGQFDDSRESIYAGRDE